MSTSFNDNNDIFSILAEPVSMNPFLTPSGQLHTDRDSPPHLTRRRSNVPFSHVWLLSPSIGTSVSDDDPLPDPLPALQLDAPTHMPSFNDVYGTTGRPTHSTPPARIHLPPPPPYNHAHNVNTSSRTRLPSDQDVVREKTMAGVPTWPPNLRLSLNANNWLEWSRELINGLKMAQLHVYPLGLLGCPNQHTVHISHRNWRSNDQMILGYITTHIFPAESQHIVNCATSTDAYQSLQQ
jgi:hypothetical protein